ncbi:MAG: CoB--CoM heterodisulfide reductase iron-sulfur subunit B family protein [Clostridiales bacterium]
MQYAYYPGCSLSATGLEYRTSIAMVCQHLGVELKEIDDWNCCGASTAHLTDHYLSLALPARNLALAEKQIEADIAVPCAACFARMKKAVQEVRDNPQIKEEIGEIIEMDYQAKYDVYSFLDILADEKWQEKIKRLVKKPLENLPVACYYGCLLVRPANIAQSDDPEYPMGMDKLIGLLGGKAVDWDFKTECCGASHAVAKQKVGLEMIYQILHNAQVNGAKAIATACPLCMINLDMRQKSINKKYGTNFHFPIYYFTELMAASFGDDLQKIGLPKHFVEALTPIQSAWRGEIAFGNQKGGEQR